MNQNYRSLSFDEIFNNAMSNIENSNYGNTKPIITLSGESIAESFAQGGIYKNIKTQLFPQQEINFDLLTFLQKNWLKLMIVGITVGAVSYMYHKRYQEQKYSAVLKQRYN